MRAAVMCPAAQPNKMSLSWAASTAGTVLGSRPAGTVLGSRPEGPKHLVALPAVGDEAHHAHLVHHHDTGAAAVRERRQQNHPLIRGVGPQLQIRQPFVQGAEPRQRKAGLFTHPAVLLPRAVETDDGFLAPSTGRYPMMKQ